jgi:hypothetical protein
VDARQGEGEAPARSALLTVWRPGPAAEELREGRLVGLTGCSVPRVEGGTVHLTATRHTQYLELEGDAAVEPRVARSLTELATIGEHNFSPLFNEVDLVAVVLR